MILNSLRPPQPAPTQPVNALNASLPAPASVGTVRLPLPGDRDGFSVGGLDYKPASQMTPQERAREWEQIGAFPEIMGQKMPTSVPNSLAALAVGIGTGLNPFGLAFRGVANFANTRRTEEVGAVTIKSDMMDPNWWTETYPSMSPSARGAVKDFQNTDVGKALMETLGLGPDPTNRQIGASITRAENEGLGRGSGGGISGSGRNASERARRSGGGGAAEGSAGGNDNAGRDRGTGGFR